MKTEKKNPHNIRLKIIHYPRSYSLFFFFTSKTNTGALIIPDIAQDIYSAKI